MSSLRDFHEAAESHCWQRRPLTGNKQSSTLNASEFLSNMVLKKFGAQTQIRPIESLRPQHTVSDKMTPCGSLWLYNGSLSASYLGINDDERQQLLIETLFLIDSAHKD